MKTLKKVACYAIIYALISLTEKRFNLSGIALALCFALIFCQENLLVSLIPYAIINALIHFSLTYLIVVACGITAVLVIALIKYKANKKYRIWAIELAFAVAQTPNFVLNGVTSEVIVYAGIGTVLGMFLCYCYIGAIYPILVRRDVIGLTEREKGSIFVLVATCFCGLNSFDVFGIKFFYCIGALCLIILALTEEKEIFGFAIAFGIGGTIASGSALEIFIVCAIATVVRFSCGVHRYLSGIACIGTFCALVYFFGEGLTVANAVPVGAVSIVAFMPEKLVKFLKGGKYSSQGKFALRTMLNRDREEVSDKLLNVAFAMRKVQNILSSEEKGEINPAVFASKLKESCCRNCARFGVCKKKAGDVLVYINKLVNVAIENGRVSLLDVDSEMGSVCVRLPKMINYVNEYLTSVKNVRDKKSGIDVGKEMIVGNVAGTAELLEELAKSINTGFSFDVEKERKIIEELGYANVLAKDVAIYGNNDKVTLSVRENDAKKPQLKQILSMVVGEKMQRTDCRKGVNGMVNLTYRPQPNYGVLYGEKQSSALEENGDCIQAVKIAQDKLLFVLSDGMGVGKDARKTGMDVVKLIETFYRAGFSHKTIFTCVSRMLALRTKETFSALDVVVMDTQSGEIDFIKQGGRESYVVTEKGVQIVSGTSLPLGIIEDGEPFIERKILSDNDVVVMVSDGVADRLSQVDMEEILSSISTVNPQQVAEVIVENALKKSEVKPDDVTAMAFRIVENKND